MAYVSAAYSKTWTKGGNDFNAKLGALLTNGPELQVCEALVGQQRQARHSSCPHKPEATGNVNDNPYKTATSSTPWIGPRPGFAWVDEHGHPLAVGPPASAAILAATNAGNTTDDNSVTTGNNFVNSSNSNGSSSQHHSGAGSTQTHAKGSSSVGMTASQRSMTLWEHVSPGMMPDTTKTPPATTAEAFTYEAQLQEPVDFTHHLKRTDFAAYTECKLRHMHHLQAAAKK